MGPRVTPSGLVMVLFSAFLILGKQSSVQQNGEVNADKSFSPEVKAVVPVQDNLAIYRRKLASYNINIKVIDQSSPECKEVRGPLWLSPPAYYSREHRTVCVSKNPKQYQLHHELIHALQFSCNVTPGLMSQQYPELNTEIPYLGKLYLWMYYSQMVEQMDLRAKKDFLSPDGIPIWEEEAWRMQELERHEILNLFDKYCYQ